MNRIALVVGISCSGKDYLIDRVGPFLPNSFSVINYGEELFELIGRESPLLDSRDQLRGLRAEEILGALRLLNSRLIERQPCVIKAHLVFKTADGLISKTDSLCELAPALNVHISAPISEIIQRRRERNRGRNEVCEVPEEVAFNQDLSIEIAREYSSKVGASFLEIWNMPEETEKNASILREALSKL